MLKIILLAAALVAGSAQAAGLSQMNVVYDLYRNGIKLGQVVDTFTRNGTRYVLSSETHASGPLKMLWPGNIHLESAGVVTPKGLRPMQFQHARSDAPNKLATARLDWKQRTITYQYKGETRRVDGLQDGAQDQLSQLYQFMFAPGLPADYSVQVVSGRGLNDYHYMRSDGGSIQTPLGAMATQQYQRITQKPDEKAITVWVAPARNNLPVQVRVSEDGVTIEQRLVRASVKG
ncbi:MAG: hypothetical protein ABT23_01905 [Thiobacillus sp. SCN 63-57]|uniref:DUF3108 domain-containing protein n=1 Tax=Thiobacillus sp. SCN 63-57 TaxID=1660145 RepID=UPI00086B4B42|nr:DUF3108 domain-containing protein [Thiobacillus sp. SCN 63-57]ODV03958.1 MAG: hypothetical protein ABT23_01905 [Thiobacillus sp. SCN 63-57]